MPFENPIFRLVLPAAAILIVVAIARMRGISRRELGVIAPDAKVAAAWIAGWIVWIIATELISRKIGIASPERWTGRSASTIAVLFVAMVILAPLAEELLFRGLFYWRVSGTAVGPFGAIIAAAAIFAAIHFQYGPAEWAFIFADAILFGLARYHSDSVMLPIAMHVLGNLYAFSQRVPLRM
jgi:membrane protease YdiL (CAAX protease family)